MEAGLNYDYYTYPVEMTISYSNVGELVDYICNDCGEYGSNDKGLHFYVWSRVPTPNCLEVEDADRVLKPLSLTVGNLTKIINENCQLPNV
jgi:hypothetical protein